MTPKPSNTHVKVTPVRSGHLQEIHVTAVPCPGPGDARSQTLSLHRSVLEQIDDPSSLQLVAERVFGKLSEKDAYLSARSEVLNEVGISSDGPVTYIEGAPVSGDALAGLHLTFIRKNTPEVRIDPIGMGKTVNGFKVTSGEVSRAYLSAIQGIAPAPADTSAVAQAQRMFEHANALLNSAGLTYYKVVCTRIYVKRLLEWYDAFNDVRTPYYAELGLMTEDGSRIPASTGIQGKLSDDCECFMDVLVVSKGSDQTCPFTRLVNPLQNEATDYGSLFARGVSVDVPDVRYVLGSGTASIDASGKSVHIGDPVAQARRTLTNFATILKAGDATPADLYHAVWYCKDASHGEIVREEMRQQGWLGTPYPIVQADVCRHDLLVEIDGSAVIPAP